METNNLSLLNFRFKLDRTPEMEYKAQRVSIPGVTLGAMPVPTPFVPYPVPGDLAYEQFFVEFMVGERMSNWLEIFRWMEGLGKPKQLGTFPSYVKDAMSDASLIVMDSAYQSIIEVKYINVFPTNLTSITMDTTLQGVQYAKSVATFACTRFEVNYIEG